MISLFLIILWMLVGVYYILMKRSHKKGSNIPPVAEGALPIIGHSLLLLDNTPALFSNVVDLFLKSLYSGLNAVTLRIGPTNAYIILDPDDGYTVANTCLRKDLFYDYFRPWLGDGLFPTSNMEIWKAHRKLILPTFHQHILDGYLSESNSQARKLVNTIEKEANKGLFDHRGYIEEMAIEYICATAMGASLDDEDRKMKASYIKASHQFMRGIVERALTFWLHNDFIYSYSSLKRKQDELSSSLHSLMEAVLKKRKNKTKEIEGSDRKQYKAFLDLLLEMAEDGSLTEKEIREEVDTFIFAGSDTSASVLKYTLMAVGTYPDVQKKIQEELQEVFQGSDRDVDKEDLPKLKYVEAVIKETMRLYPVAPMIGRYLDKEVHLKNYTIPAGSRCYVIMHILHRHPMWGADALLYNPDRWLDANTLPDNPNAFAPFGMGRRTCVGSHFAMRTLKTALSHFLRHYSVKGDISKLRMQFDVIIRPVEGYHISIEKREPLQKE